MEILYSHVEQRKVKEIISNGCFTRKFVTLKKSRSSSQRYDLYKITVNDNIGGYLLSGNFKFNFRSERALMEQIYGATQWIFVEQVST